jgi:proline iminopeptidase
MCDGGAMRCRSVVLALLVSCHPQGAGKPAVPAPAGPRTLVVTSDIPLAVTVFGPDTAKQTVIVVTGGPGLSHHYALPLAKLASSELRVAFYDQRGTGASGRLADTAENHTLAHHVADLEAIRAALGAEKIHVIGHSWGSMIAQHYAFAHEDRVASLVILNGIPSSALPFVEGLNRADTRLTKLGEQGLATPAWERKHPTHDGDCVTVMAMLPAYYADPKFPPPAHLAQMTCHDVGDATFASIGMYWDNRPQLAKLHVRSLVMTGDGDLFGTAWADDLAAAIAGAKKVILPACGHMMWDECPDALFGELRAALK